MHMDTYTEENLTFSQLYKDYQAMFVNLANTYVRNDSAAEDITSEAIIYYWENKHFLSEVTNIPAYILTIIKNKSLNYLRHVRIEEEYSEDVRIYKEWELNARITSLEACEPYELFTKEIRGIIQSTLDALPERTRQIFLMSRKEDKTYKEIAVLMNMTTKGVDFHICKALKAFQTNLKDYYPLFLYFFLKSH